MESEKTEVQFIYIHEVSVAIAKAILFRDHGNRFPNGIYELDKDNTPKLDEKNDPIYTNKALGQLAADYHYYRDIVEDHLVIEETPPPSPVMAVEERDDNSNIFLNLIKSFLKVF